MKTQGHLEVHLGNKSALAITDMAEILPRLQLK